MPAVAIVNRTLTPYLNGATAFCRGIIADIHPCRTTEDILYGFGVFIGNAIRMNLQYRARQILFAHGAIAHHDHFIQLTGGGSQLHIIDLGWCQINFLALVAQQLEYQFFCIQGYRNGIGTISF
ncbi:hypothetical protein D3C85_1385200 [compost metagenome]